MEKTPDAGRAKRINVEPFCPVAALFRQSCVGYRSMSAEGGEAVMEYRIVVYRAEKHDPAIDSLVANDLVDAYSHGVALIDRDPGVIRVEIRRDENLLHTLRRRSDTRE